MASLKCESKWVIVLLGAIFVVSCLADICPDHKMSCRKGQTCCSDEHGGYACCPYDNATCCTDGLHCCPEDTTCDLSAGRCRRSTKIVEQRVLIPATNNTLHPEVVGFAEFVGVLKNKKECPDMKQSCPTSYTCCKDPEEGYSCCPYENATCCSDLIHCCPQGKKCGNGSCV